MNTAGLGRCFIGLVLVATAACADDTSGDNSGSNNTTATNNAQTGGPTNSGASNGDPATVARCAPAVFAQTVPFTAGDELPFQFDIPAGFGNIDSSTDGLVTGGVFDVTSTGASGEFQTTYTVARTPTENPEALIENWRAIGETDSTIDYGGTPKPAWSSERDLVDSVRFFVTVGDDEHQVSILWDGPVVCLDERRAVRDLALSTLAPNPDSTFPN